LDKNNLHSLYKNIISPGVSLTCINIDKFKASCITINLLCELKPETASLNALLPRVLRRGTLSLPDMDSIASALDGLYGVRIEPIVRKKGEIHCIGFYIDFPDDRYIPGAVNILEEAIKIACEMLLSPFMENSGLSEYYTTGEKSNLIDDIRAAINDKRGYAEIRLIEEMCATEAFGIGKLGNEAQASEITARSLTSHYNELLNNSSIEIFYCGCAEPQRVEAAFNESLKKLPEHRVTVVPKTSIIYDPITDSPRRFDEMLDVTQGKLTVGLRLGDVMKEPDYPALMLFNTIFGGSVSSKLFLNVREKLSLCYYASSMIDKHKGVMIISSGVDSSNFEKALCEILSQLENVKQGEISDWEFTSAKRYAVTAIMSALDRPGGLEDLYFDSIISAVPYDPIYLSDLIGDVTVKRVIKAASQIKVDSIYLLSGNNDWEVEDEAD